jgi:hypothetical protein
MGESLAITKHDITAAMSEKAKLAKCSAQGIWGDSPYLE